MKFSWIEAKKDVAAGHTLKDLQKKWPGVTAKTYYRIKRLVKKGQAKK